MKICSFCSFENSDDSQYCRSCGKNTAQNPSPGALIRCSKCGYINPSQTLFCRKCEIPLPQDASNRARLAAILANPSKNYGIKDHPSFLPYTVLAVLIPMVGFIFGIIYLGKSSKLENKLGRHVLLTGIISYFVRIAVIIIWVFLYKVFVNPTV